MSWFAREWAEEHAPVATVYERVILMVLADKASKDGTGAYPSRRRMAKAALCDIETIKRHLKGLLERKLIARGDQSLAEHIPLNLRPIVYDLLIPHSWYSAAQLKEVNQERDDHDLPPLTRVDRPDIAAAPPKKRRSDIGKPRKRRNQADDSSGELSDPPSPPVDNSGGGNSEFPPGALSDPPGGTLSSDGRNSQTPKPKRDQPSLDPEDQTPPPHPGSARARDVPDPGIEEGEGSSEEGHNGPDQHGPAAALLRAAMDDVATDFPEPEPGTKHTLLRLVDEILRRGVSAGRIRDALVSNLAGVRDLGAVWTTRLERIPTPVTSPRRALPNLCGECDGRPGEGVHTRVVFMDDEHEKSIPCPRCHPDALAAAPEIA